MFYQINSDVTLSIKSDITLSFTNSTASDVKSPKFNLSCGFFKSICIFKFAWNPF